MAAENRKVINAGDAYRCPMKVQGITWVGVKTDQFAALSAFCRDVLGLSAMSSQADVVVFRLPDGDLFELFGPGSREPPAQFAAYRVVCGFRVGDIEGARRELQGAGVELLGDIHRDIQSGYAWQHFRGPDGLVYELASDPSLSSGRNGEVRDGPIDNPRPPHRSAMTPQETTETRLAQ